MIVFADAALAVIPSWLDEMPSEVRNGGREQRWIFGKETERRVAVVAQEATHPVGFVAMIDRENPRGARCLTDAAAHPFLGLPANGAQPSLRGLEAPVFSERKAVLPAKMILAGEVGVLLQPAPHSLLHERLRLWPRAIFFRVCRNPFRVSSAPAEGRGYRRASLVSSALERTLVLDLFGRLFANRLGHAWNFTSTRAFIAQRDPTQARFLKGWLARLAALRKAVGL